MTESEETCTARPRLSIQGVLMPIAVWAALLFIQNWQSMIVVSIVLLTWVFGCNRTRRAVLWVSPAAFLPPLAVIAFVQFSSKATAAATFVSLQKWAILPGMFVERMISDYFPNTVLIAAPMLIAVSVTSAVFLAAVTCIRFVPKSRGIVVTLVLVLSLVSSMAYVNSVN